MFLKCSTRVKNGKPHRSWSIVESRRVHGGGSVQRHVLYLGEINDSQQAAWQKSIAVFAEGESEARQVALFPEDRVGTGTAVPQIQLPLHELTLHRPRQWGTCWLALELKATTVSNQANMISVEEPPGCGEDGRRTARASRARGWQAVATARSLKGPQGQATPEGG